MISKRISITVLALVTANVILGSSAFAAEGVKRAAVIDVSGSESFEELNAKLDGVKVESKSKAVEKKVVKNKKPSVAKTANAKIVEKKVVENTDPSVAKTTDAKVTAPENCDFNYPDAETNMARLVAVRRQFKVNTGETFRVKIFLQNTSNIPWFSNKSECHGAKMSLGTDDERNHESPFYQKELAGWESSSRIGMDQLRIDPNQIASFTFWAKAGNSPDVYKEYFTPMLKDSQWMDTVKIPLDVIIGDTGENAGEVRQKIAFSRRSGSVRDFDLHANKTIKVDLSEQKVYAYIGDTDVREFRVSTGKASTPTPTGKYDIILKQDVRVGFQSPHYIMPKFMMFQSSGYGFHALPSLARNGGDAFWTEAREHIGIPVSHGCVRLLPEDADWLFDFTENGTKVEINY